MIRLHDVPGRLGRASCVLRGRVAGVHDVRGRAAQARQDVVVLTVRTARPSDEAALLPIDRATWTSAVSPGPTPRPDDPFFEPGTVFEDVLVAERDGAVVGYVRLHQPGPLPSHAHVLVVNGLAVAPEHQRSGAGRALLEAALAQARARGASKVTLRVLRPNLPARRLYEACGFVEEGVLRAEFLLDGRLVDDVLLAKALDEAGGTSRT